MTLASYLDAMPKIEVHVALEGAMGRDTLAMIADQNDISTSIKHFNDWMNLISKPDYKRLAELVRMTCSWLQVADDVTRVVYELGVSLHKQNVRYAEVGVNPLLYPALTLNLEDFFAALNDGRDRVQRAWGVEMAWILMIPRDEPRRADEIARFASTIAARRMNILALGLSGSENAQPVGQFERAFKSVEKKDVPRVVRAGDYSQVDGITKAMDVLSPTRILDGRGAAESPDLLKRLADTRTPIVLSPMRAALHGWVPNLAELPLMRLYDADVPVVIGADMPQYYGTLTTQYRALVEQGKLSVDEVNDLALNAVRYSLMSDEAKRTYETTFRDEYVRLRAEHQV
jgi:adenosine deaminase